MRQLFLLLSLFIAGFAIDSSAQSPHASPTPDPIVGHWRWAREHSGTPALVDFRADGTATRGKEAGTWKAIPADTEERKYQVIWTDNSINVIDLILSDDHNLLDGKNASNQTIHCERIQQ